MYLKLVNDSDFYGIKILFKNKNFKIKQIILWEKGN